MSLEKSVAGQEETEPVMEQQTCSKLGKEHDKAVYCHPAYLIYRYIYIYTCIYNYTYICVCVCVCVYKIHKCIFMHIYNLYTSCKMPGWINHNLESRLPGELKNKQTLPGEMSITSNREMTPPLRQKPKN